ncbi:MAG: hypothetical protein PHU61_02420 [Candidatus Absconditabacteria bacterium]|nr:hypothetical protein [Candidatus Absconditabacteria bacterium]MDD3868171.1 hypothetical protein [Candidatus Absconditabacteria bacterium]MDD4714558.1 hypothetical protein [Candidatus Absconditabacteria bacterium]
MTILSCYWRNEGEKIYPEQERGGLPESIKKVIEDYKENISSLIAVSAGPSITNPGFFTIETSNFHTLISFPPHHGRDPSFSQYNKDTEETYGYRPYSHEGYNFYINLLLAYHKQYGCLPTLDFSKIDKEDWENEIRTNESQTRGDILNLFSLGDAMTYFHAKERFSEDNEGFNRIILSKDKKTERTGFGIKDNQTEYRFAPDFNSDRISHIVLENNLLPLYTQAFICAHNSASGNSANIQKIYEMTKYLLENDSIDVLRARKETPL